MSRDPRKNFYNRDRQWNRVDYRDRFDKSRPVSRNRSRSPPRDLDKPRSRSPRVKNENELDENILSEIAKLPEPSELWDNQFQDTNFSAPPPGFPVEGSGYTANYQPSYSGIYDDFPSVTSVPPPSHVPDMSVWNQMSLPPPPAPPTMFDKIKKEAIESEMRHQKAALSKQREEYTRKAAILKKELDTLKDQRNELRGDAKRSPSPDTKRFLKENTKLQLEIQNKLKTLDNVVEMLNKIIGDASAHDPPDSDGEDRNSKRKSRSPTSKKFNYVYYDPEMHWCRVCNEFPSTAKDYLNHLHSQAHHKMAAAHMEAPWHSMTGVNEGFPSYTSAPTKRTPIRGLQFFVPSTAWYCKLCDQFIGDLHCASAHLKSITHSKNYTNFVEQNPHWETDWMSDRQKAFEKARAGNKLKGEEKPQYTAQTITFSKDGFSTKNKESTPTPDDKKKKKDKKKKSKRKRSSSTSSSTSSSDSEPAKKKKSKKDKLKGQPDEKTLTEWMTSLQMDRLNDHDRKLLDSLKHRMKYDKKEEKRHSSDREHSSSSQRKRDDRRDERRDERRDDRRDERRDDRRDERRDDRRDDKHSSLHSDSKKPEIRKMPFIGKMPVYKNLNKTNKVDDQKKDDQKKKEEDEVSKKRREEMDAEIQKKVAEFKEKIAKAQMERAAAELPPPAVALPTQLGAAVPHAFLHPPPHAHPHPPHAQHPPHPLPPQPPGAQPPATLPKDFQDALDIIFPSEVKNAANEMVQAQQDLFGMPPGLPPGFPLGMSPFPHLSILGQPPPQMMMGHFDMNNPLFQPRPQLYDTHVPLVPNQKQRQMNKNRPNNNKNGNKNKNSNPSPSPISQAKNSPSEQALPDSTESETRLPGKEATSTRNKEELDELAMLGIDASDVGAM